MKERSNGAERVINCVKSVLRLLQKNSYSEWNRFSGVACRPPSVFFEMAYRG